MNITINNIKIDLLALDKFKEDLKDVDDWMKDIHP